MPFNTYSTNRGEGIPIHNHYIDMAQLMRDAEARRAQAAKDISTSLWREIKWLFRSRRALETEHSHRHERPATA
jgi:hypothetical protein